MAIQPSCLGYPKPELPIGAGLIDPHLRGHPWPSLMAPSCARRRARAEVANYPILSERLLDRSPLGTTHLRPDSSPLIFFITMWRGPLFNWRTEGD